MSNNAKLITDTGLLVYGAVAVFMTIIFQFKQQTTTIRYVVKSFKTDLILRKKLAFNEQMSTVNCRWLWFFDISSLIIYKVKCPENIYLFI